MFDATSLRSLLVTNELVLFRLPEDKHLLEKNAYSRKTLYMQRGEKDVRT